MTNPTCPFCNATMVPRLFVGYYEVFTLWQCACEKIPGSTIMAGSYSGAEDGESAVSFPVTEAERLASYREQEAIQLA